LAEGIGAKHRAAVRECVPQRIHVALRAEGNEKRYGRRELEKRAGAHETELRAKKLDGMISTVPEGMSVRVVESRIFESLKSRASNFDASRSSLLVDWSLR
jgi:hypothetical protein